MPIKVENQSSTKLPRYTESYLAEVFEFLPKEHVRGIDRIRIVDAVSDVPVRGAGDISKLPGLYHPRQAGRAAWLEVAAGVFLPSTSPFYKRLMPRLSFKGNLAAILVSLVGQHYYLTFRHSIKRGQIEGLVRQYTETQLKRWHESRHTTRARIFKPIQPYLERWGRSLQKKAAAEKKKARR